MTKNQERTLYSCRSDKPITLAKAVQSCSQFLQGAIALFYSPQSCQIAKLDDARVHDSYGREINLSKHQDIFEARVFNDNCELRWLNRLNGEGDAVLLSEFEQSIDGFLSHKSKFRESIEQQYLLWGEPAKNSPKSPNWQRLASARIGKLDVPIDQSLEGKQRVYLSSLEYLAKVDKFGNFAVIEERLVSLEVKS
ncbi:type III-D CRISPR-associated protein Csx19 [Baaleninema simplex]|uniref:type III-D CRISPR-associated protein Csx19 n=1 Tax=Baaleninema simplex TaxID=2862350 RepID=UPI00034C7D4F|nr:CRISPR-associated protein Csx19 [Baaleninema simplex]